MHSALDGVLYLAKVNVVNETVSLGDTAISLDTLQLQLPGGGGGILDSQNSKSQVLAIFSFSGVGGGGGGGGRGRILDCSRIGIIGKMN